MERGPHRTPLCLAVPAAVRELLSQKPVGESIARLAEVAAQRENTTVDAGLGFTFEEWRIPELWAPRDSVAHEANHLPHALALRVNSHVSQEHQGVQVGPPMPGRDAVAPVAVRPLLAKKLRAPSLGGNARPLGGHHFSRLMHDVPHDLPPDRRVGIEQPLHGRWLHQSLRGNHCSAVGRCFTVPLRSGGRLPDRMHDQRNHARHHSDRQQHQRTQHRPLDREPLVLAELHPAQPHEEVGARHQRTEQVYRLSHQ